MVVSDIVSASLALADARRDLELAYEEHTKKSRIRPDSTVSNDAIKNLNSILRSPSTEHERQWIPERPPSSKEPSSAENERQWLPERPPSSEEPTARSWSPTVQQFAHLHAQRIMGLVAEVNQSPSSPASMEVRKALRWASESHVVYQAAHEPPESTQKMAESAQHHDSAQEGTRRAAQQAALSWERPRLNERRRVTEHSHDDVLHQAWQKALRRSNESWAELTELESQARHLANKAACMRTPPAIATALALETQMARRVAAVAQSERQEERTRTWSARAQELKQMRRSTSARIISHHGTRRVDELAGTPPCLAKATARLEASTELVIAASHKIRASLAGKPAAAVQMDPACTPRSPAATPRSQSALRWGLV